MRVVLRAGWKPESYRKWRTEEGVLDLREVPPAEVARRIAEAVKVQLWKKVALTRPADSKGLEG
eukprot:10902094-Alexandrium_andersonii.AAC.1